MNATLRAQPPHTIDSQLSPLAELDRYLHALRQNQAEREWLRTWGEPETCEHCGVGQGFVLNGMPCRRCQDDERETAYANGQTAGQLGWW